MLRVSLGSRPWHASLLLDASLLCPSNETYNPIISALGTSSEATQGLPRANPPKIPKYPPKKTLRLRELFQKVCANFCLVPCNMSQEPNANCSEKLVQMNFFIYFVWIFRVDFLL